MEYAEEPKEVQHDQRGWFFGSSDEGGRHCSR